MSDEEQHHTVGGTMLACCCAYGYSMARAKGHIRLHFLWSELIWGETDLVICKTRQFCFFLGNQVIGSIELAHAAKLHGAQQGPCPLRNCLYLAHQWGMRNSIVKYWAHTIPLWPPRPHICLSPIGTPLEVLVDAIFLQNKAIYYVF